MDTLHISNDKIILLTAKVFSNYNMKFVHTCKRRAYHPSDYGNFIIVCGDT